MGTMLMASRGAVQNKLRMVGHSARIVELDSSGGYVDAKPLYRDCSQQSVLPEKCVTLGVQSNLLRIRKQYVLAYPRIRLTLSLKKDLSPQVIKNARELTYGQSGPVAFPPALQNRQPPRTFLHAERREEASA